MDLLDIWVVITTLIYVAVGVVVGIRLLLLARRTRGLPELLLGLGELLLSGLVPPFFAVVQAAQDETWVRAGVFLGHLTYTVGCNVMIAFTWQVFRPGVAWARVLTLGSIAVMTVAGCFGMARGFLPSDLASLRVPATTAFVLMEWISVVGFVWTAVEAFRMHGLMKKQAALGLADPVVVNRLLLWGCVGVAGVLAAGAPAVAAGFGVSTMTHAPTRLLCAAGTLFSSVCIQLAFLPPQGYLRWVRERASAGAKAA
jgi:hypothetical protein